MRLIQLGDNCSYFIGGKGDDHYGQNEIAYFFSWLDSFIRWGLAEILHGEYWFYLSDKLSCKVLSREAELAKASERIEKRYNDAARLVTIDKVGE